MKQLLIFSINCYKLCLSPFLSPACRFHPSCSQYAIEAIDTHGAVRGVWRAIKRLGRCHPFGACGFDPVD